MVSPKSFEVNFNATFVVTTEVVFAFVFTFIFTLAFTDGKVSINCSFASAFILDFSKNENIIDFNLALSCISAFINDENTTHCVIEIRSSTNIIAKIDNLVAVIRSGIIVITNIDEHIDEFSAIIGSDNFRMGSIVIILAFVSIIINFAYAMIDSSVSVCGIAIVVSKIGFKVDEFVFLHPHNL